jgi:hypothetical protein
MSANTQPIFGRAPDIQLGGAILGPTAVTAQDGTGTLAVIFQADTTEGGFVDRITLKPVGSPAATVARIFICTVTGAFTSGTSNTAANTALLTEVGTPITTSSNVNSQGEYTIPLRLSLPPGYRLLIGFGTSTGAAGTGFAVTTAGSKY